MARLYKLVRKLVDYHAAMKTLPAKSEDLTRREVEYAALEADKPADPKEAKKHEKTLRKSAIRWPTRARNWRAWKKRSPRSNSIRTC
ncbi:MAG: hypothetical protein QM811_25750 [Pirellulales bacterium]